MKSDEEIDFLNTRVTELEIQLLGWEERWEAFITGEHRAMEERAEVAEVRRDDALRAVDEMSEALRKIVEFVQPGASKVPFIGTAQAARAAMVQMVRERVDGADRATRERDVMQAHCRGLVRVLLMLAPYPPEVAAGVLAVVDGARAALEEAGVNS